MANLWFVSNSPPQALSSLPEGLVANLWVEERQAIALSNMQITESFAAAAKLFRNWLTVPTSQHQNRTIQPRYACRRKSGPTYSTISKEEA